MPKEIRNPKSEYLSVGDVLGGDSAFWNWGEEPATAEMVLRDGEGKPPPPDLMERTAQFGEAKELNLIFGAIWRK